MTEIPIETLFYFSSLTSLKTLGRRKNKTSFFTLFPVHLLEHWFSTFLSLQHQILKIKVIKKVLFWITFKDNLLFNDTPKEILCKFVCFTGHWLRTTVLESCATTRKTSRFAKSSFSHSNIFLRGLSLKKMKILTFLWANFSNILVSIFCFKNNFYKKQVLQF